MSSQSSQTHMSVDPSQLQSSLSSPSVPGFHIEDTSVSPMSGLTETFAGAGETERQANLYLHRNLSATSSQDSCHMEEVEEKGVLDVKIKRAPSIRRNNSAIEAGMPCYNIISKPRGLAMIVDIEKFDNDVQERRVGSHVDVDNLKKLFRGLYFDVIEKHDLCRRDFEVALRELATDYRHLHGDMMILAILSHGRDGHIYTAEGHSIPTEAIYELFNNQNAPLLIGKPKFFIIQACRGEQNDFGQKEMLPDEVSMPMARKRRIGSDKDTIPFSNFEDVDRARPTWEDMIIAYSTIPGYVSLRDHLKGTWFIQSLVEVFMNHAHDKELIDLLRITSERLSQFSNVSQEKQTCNIEMRHLYKRIYFNPGLPEAKSSPKGLRRSQSDLPDSPRRRRQSAIGEEDDYSDIDQ
ncbi:hypothetical protein TCAL_01435 [Tigriopus californicus]|uniref:Caspase n=1 Tax=Tigriopus californicus TaxID=6832 RepID=A0A553NUJ2_TIGCA|nr:caspase-6-like [Tigriopus californicus]TRY69101.1 hypothetical protein TCAL_01435 [Tigriopus californicus]|eukprot:TCALIF_01435-PA protein Name:"Similar to ced-3 Cell death protein 3 (Caenorhabditis elegans)" AED:0.06 eAED:0.06 QI:366/1/1/1/0.5/0.33/3/237/407